MISIFTPSHDPKWLDESFWSIATQTLDEGFEWVVLLNNGAEWAPPIQADEWVRVIKSEELGKGVGYYKREAVSYCRGEILVELDHDDLLTERPRHMVRYDARANIGGAARWKRHNQGDRPRRIRLRVSKARRRRKYGGTRRQTQESPSCNRHGVPREERPHEPCAIVSVYAASATNLFRILPRSSTSVSITSPALRNVLVPWPTPPQASATLTCLQVS